MICKRCKQDKKIEKRSDKLLILVKEASFLMIQVFWQKRRKKTVENEIESVVKPKSPNFQKKLPIVNSSKKQSNLTNDFLSGNDSGTSYSESGDETEEEKSVSGDEKLTSEKEHEESDVASKANLFSDEEKSLSDQVKKVTTSLLSTRVKSSLICLFEMSFFRK